MRNKCQSAQRRDGHGGKQVGKLGCLDFDSLMRSDDHPGFKRVGQPPVPAEKGSVPFVLCKVDLNF